MKTGLFYLLLLPVLLMQVGAGAEAKGDHNKNHKGNIARQVSCCPMLFPFPSQNRPRPVSTPQISTSQRLNSLPRTSVGVSTSLPPIRPSNNPYLQILGIAQDGGYPHAACEKACCREAWEGKAERQLVSCLALVDPATGQSWMLDATPDFKDQQYLLKKATGHDLSGIFLTHAHIGHYTGLMQLGREVIGTRDVPVYAMPRMLNYLRTNGPWSQLVSLHNIALQPLHADSTIRLTDQLSITPFRVPHRDEYSETVGYRIDGPNRSAIFIPDIDKWEKWDRSIDSLLQSVDHAFVDGTFFQNGEIAGRDMSEIPHPFIRESTARFQKAGIDPGRVTFIHFNHTNPVMRPDSPERKEVLEAGFGLAQTGQRIAL